MTLVRDGGGICSCW